MTPSLGHPDLSRADYDRDGLTLYEGDCLRLMESMEDSSVDLIATDPPYKGVKKEAWDNQWKSDADFIAWIGKLCEQWQRILKPNGSLYVFASPQMAWSVEGAVRERFNVLNRIRWNKPSENIGRRHVAQIVDKSIARSFLPACEEVIFAEHFNADNIAKGEAGYQRKCDELRGFVFEPLRAYLASERDRAGFTTRRVAEHYQRKTGSRTVTGMAGHWFERVQWSLPTEENYDWLRELFNRGDGGEYLRREYEDLRREYEDLRREFESLRREFESLRRPFSVTADVPYTDVWTFPTVNSYPGKHPCEKPLAMMEHIVRASSRDGATVLDCFVGSGVTAEACRNLGRDFIGMDLDLSHSLRRMKKLDEANPLFSEDAA